jgi:hypothetical protein
MMDGDRPDNIHCTSRRLAARRLLIICQTNITVYLIVRLKPLVCGALQETFSFLKDPNSSEMSELQFATASCVIG